MAWAVNEAAAWTGGRNCWMTQAPASDLRFTLSSPHTSRYNEGDGVLKTKAKRWSRGGREVALDMGGRVQNKLSWGGAGDEWAPTEVFLSLDSCGEHLTIGSRARIQEWQNGRNRMLQCSGHVVRMGGKGEEGSAASAAPADGCAGSCALLLLPLVIQGF
jgi:hypothetical protein